MLLKCNIFISKKNDCCLLLQYIEYINLERSVIEIFYVKCKQLYETKTFLSSFHMIYLVSIHENKVKYKAA